MVKNKRTVRKRIIPSLHLEKDPLEEVKLVSFSFSAKNREDAAFLQYTLLLLPEVLQAHVDFDSKKGMAVCAPAFDLSKELFGLGLAPKFLRVEWISYGEYQNRNTCAVRH